MGKAWLGWSLAAGDEAEKKEAPASHGERCRTFSRGLMPSSDIFMLREDQSLAHLRSQR